MSAYAFTFMSFPMRRVLFVGIFALLLIPGVLTLIPLYLQIKRLDFLGVSGNWGGLILPYIAGGQAFSIFVLRTFFGGSTESALATLLDIQPAELDEAARRRMKELIDRSAKEGR